MNFLLRLTVGQLSFVAVGQRVPNFFLVDRRRQLFHAKLTTVFLHEKKKRDFLIRGDLVAHQFPTTLKNRLNYFDDVY